MSRVRTLKGCPFCGRRAVYQKSPYNYMVAVRCDMGCAESPQFMTKKGAAAWWNKRADVERDSGA